MVAAGAALLAFAPIGVRVSELGPQATGLWRMAFALPLLAFLAARAAPPDRAAAGRAGPALLLAGVFFGLDIAFWHASLHITTVANATLLSNMTPILAAAVGLIAFKERVTGGFLVGAPIALAGAALLGVSRAASGQGEEGYVGEALAALSAVCYAVYLIMVSRLRRRLATWPVMLWSTAGSLGLMAVACAAMGEALFPSTLQGWLVLLALGCVVHVGGQGLIAMGLGQLPITVSTVLLWVQPVAAAALGWALFGESLGLLGLLGAGLVLAGLYSVQRDRRVEPRAG
jgi:drug/metabolite transporter (DMT)-like permease